MHCHAFLRCVLGITALACVPCVCVCVCVCVTYQAPIPCTMLLLPSSPAIRDCPTDQPCTWHVTQLGCGCPEPHTDACCSSATALTNDRHSATLTQNAADTAAERHLDGWRCSVGGRETELDLITQHRVQLKGGILRGEMGKSLTVRAYTALVYLVSIALVLRL